jgi:transposase
MLARERTLREGSYGALDVGLDVSQEQTAVCVVDDAGQIVWQGRCASTPEAIAATVRAKAPHAKRIGLEAGPLSSWHWHALRALGLPVICLDARHVRAALSAQVNKTDKNDALGLAQIVRTGWYREVQVKSFDSHARRGLLTSRATGADASGSGQSDVRHSQAFRPDCREGRRSALRRAGP